VLTDVTICWQVWRGTSKAIAVLPSKGWHSAAVREQRFTLLSSWCTALCWNGTGQWCFRRTSTTFYCQRWNISSHYHFDTVLYLDPEHTSPLQSICEEPFRPRTKNKFLQPMLLHRKCWESVCHRLVAFVLVHSVSEGHLKLANWHINAVAVNHRLWPLIPCSRGGQTPNNGATW
jgi:hypothetical protein